MIIELPKLPYELDALEPHISKEAMDFHRNKHHQGYVDNLNKLIQGTRFAKESDLQGVYIRASHMTADGVVCNNAAQVWNHTFYFESLAPANEDDVPKTVDKYLTKHFGSVKDFQTQFNNIAKKFFGSGWIWLVDDDEGESRIVGVENAGRRFDLERETPLLTWDCWEHNYYIDFRNDRSAALEAFWKVVDWSKVEERINNIKYDR